MQHLALFESMDLSELLASEAPAHDEAGRQATFYAQSWLLVHYLVTDETRRARLGSLLGMLKDGTDIDEAVRQALGSDLAALQEELRQYQRTYGGWFKIGFDDPIEKQAVEMRAMAPGEVLCRLGDLLAHLGAPSAAAARAHLEAALAQGGPVAPIRAALGTAAEVSGDLDEADKQYRLATEAEGADAEVYARRGTFLLHRFLDTHPAMAPTGEPPGPVLEARALLQRSVELDPDGVEALAALGATYLFGAAGASEGLHALGRANALRPDRLDVLVNLACMLAKSGKSDAPWSVIKNQLAPRAGDPAQVRQAESCVVMEQWDAANERLGRGDSAGAVEILSDLERRVTDAELVGQVQAYRRRLENREATAVLGTDSIPPEDAARIVDQHNQAVGLLKDGKLEEGLALLERALEGCAEGDLCAQVRSTADSVRRAIERKRIVDRVNEAVALLNAGKRKQAIEKLRALEQESTVPELTARIRELLDELGAR